MNKAKTTTFDKKGNKISETETVNGVNGGIIIK